MSGAIGPQVVTLGESMVLFDPVERGSIARGGTFVARVAGAESNTAIGLVRLGVPAAWVSVVGADPFGEFIRGTLAVEGVAVDAVRIDRRRRTGVFFKERLAPGRTEVHYYRDDSAASGLTPGDVPAELLGGCRMLHVSGITLGLSRSARAAVLHAVELAKAGGALVSIDPNLRKRLPDGSGLTVAIRDVMERADIVLGGLSELEAVLGVASAAEVFGALPGRDVVARVGPRGALVAGDDGEVVRIPPIEVAEVVDAVGAGDAFNAAYLAGRLRGYRHVEAVEIGTAGASFALRTTGDWEALASWEEVMAVNGGRELSEAGGAARDG